MLCWQLLLTPWLRGPCATRHKYPEPLPRVHGKSVVPSGRLPSCCSKLTGSLTAGTWARLIALQRIHSCDDDAGACGRFCDRTNHVDPEHPLLFPHVQVCDSHALHPSLWVTATLTLLLLLLLLLHARREPKLFYVQH